MMIKLINIILLKKIVIIRGISTNKNELINLTFQKNLRLFDDHQFDLESNQLVNFKNISYIYFGMGIYFIEMK